MLQLFCDDFLKLVIALLWFCGLSRQLGIIYDHSDDEMLNENCEIMSGEIWWLACGAVTVF